MANKSTGTSRRLGLDATRITEAALGLTERCGLEGWSVRDLATELDVVPSVVYHYFETKEAVQQTVIDRVCGTVEIPDGRLEWREWFIKLLLEMRTVMLRYNGIADAVLRGRLGPAHLPIIEGAFAKLHEAGFGAMAPVVCTMIFNVAESTIASRDHQSAVGPNRHDIDAMLAGLTPMADDSPALRDLTGGFLGRLSGAGGEEVSERYFRLLIESLLDGLVHVVRDGITR